jgi:hypothetical protein
MPERATGERARDGIEPEREVSRSRERHGRERRAERGGGLASVDVGGIASDAREGGAVQRRAG